MIDCHGRLVTSSRLLHTVEQERKRKIHEKRLETINKRHVKDFHKDNQYFPGNYEH